MHPFRFLGCAFLLLTSHAWSTEPVAPAQLPASRYTAMAEKSPFALATAAAPPAEPQASFAANWYITGIGRVGDTDFVSVKSRDAAMQFSLFGSEPHPQTGVSVASVNWSDTIGKSTVILQKGTEMAKLEFNEAELHGPAPGAAAPGNAQGGAKGGVRPLPGAAPGPIPMTGATTVPGASLPPGATPRPLPVIVTPRTSNQQFPTTPGNPSDIRRRVRPIVPPPQ